MISQEVWEAAKRGRRIRTIGGSWADYRWISGEGMLVWSNSGNCVTIDKLVECDWEVEQLKSKSLTVDFDISEDKEEIVLAKVGELLKGMGAIVFYAQMENQEHKEKKDAVQ